MRKGITPVISTVLLLMIAIAIISIAFGWFTNMFSIASNQAGEEVGHTASEMGKQFIIESATSNEVYIRNMGSSIIKKEELSVYKNGELVDPSKYTIPIDGINKGMVGTLAFQDVVINEGDTINIKYGLAEQTYRTGSTTTLLPAGCDNDGRCASGCPDGDTDCACTSEGGTELCSGFEYCDGSLIPKHLSSEAGTCCIGECLSATCEADGHCVATGCTNGDPDCECSAEGGKICIAGLEVCNINDVLFHSGSGTCCIVTCSQDPAIVSMWHFDEGFGSTVSDSSGNGNHGIVTGATWTTNSKIGNAISFDGVDDYILISDSSSLDSTSSITISTWLYLDTNPDCNGNNNWRIIMHKASTPYGATSGFDLLLEEGRSITWDVGTGSASQRYNGGLIPVGAWTFLIVSYDVATHASKIYINGAEASGSYWTTSTGNIAPNNNALYINYPSVLCPNGEGDFPGKIDEVIIWNRALTATDIQEIYNSQN